jgi:hypothetical protein
MQNPNTGILSPGCSNIARFFLNGFSFSRSDPKTPKVGSSGFERGVSLRLPNIEG